MSVANGAFGKSAQGAFVQSAQGSARAVAVGEDLCFEGTSRFFDTTFFGPYCEPSMPSTATGTNVPGRTNPIDKWTGGTGSVFTGASSGHTVTVGTLQCDDSPGTANNITEVWNVTLGGGAPAGSYFPFMVVNRPKPANPNQQMALSFSQTVYQSGPPFLFLGDAGEREEVYSSDCDAITSATQVLEGANYNTCISGFVAAGRRRVSGDFGVFAPGALTGYRVYDSSPGSTGAWYEIGAYVCTDELVGPDFFMQNYNIADGSFNIAGAIHSNRTTGALDRLYVPSAGGNEFVVPAGGGGSWTMLPPA